MTINTTVNIKKEEEDNVSGTSCDSEQLHCKERSVKAEISQNLPPYHINGSSQWRGLVQQMVNFKLLNTIRCMLLVLNTLVIFYSGLMVISGFICAHTSTTTSLCVGILQIFDGKTWTAIMPSVLVAIVNMIADEITRTYARSQQKEHSHISVTLKITEGDIDREGCSGHKKMDRRDKGKRFLMEFRVFILVLNAILLIQFIFPIIAMPYADTSPYKWGVVLLIVTLTFNTTILTIIMVLEYRVMHNIHQFDSSITDIVQSPSRYI